MSVTFDGQAKRIYVTGVANQDVQGLYSDWKEWAQGNLQWEQAFRTFGGDDTVGGQTAPRYFFLMNGWRVVVDGIDVVFSTNLYTDEGDDPVIPINNGTAIVNNSDSPTILVSESGSNNNNNNAPSVEDITAAIRPLLEVINEGVKDASLLIPHNEDLP